MAIVELLLSKSEYYLIFVGLNAVYLNPHFRKFFSQFSLEEIFQNLFETGKYLFSLSLKASGFDCNSNVRKAWQNLKKKKNHMSEVHILNVIQAARI